MAPKKQAGGLRVTLLPFELFQTPIAQRLMQTLSGMEALDVPKDRLTSLCLVLELAMLDQVIPGTQKLSATNVERSGARGGLAKNT